VRIGILNQLTEAAIRDIVTRFADAMRDMGATLDQQLIEATLDKHYAEAIAAQ
jgi:hypothetical protein